MPPKKTSPLPKMEKISPIHPSVSLHLGECCEYLKTLTPNTINMIYLDPPFNSD